MQRAVQETKWHILLSLTCLWVDLTCMCLLDGKGLESQVAKHIIIITQPGSLRYVGCWTVSSTDTSGARLSTLCAGMNGRALHGA